ncbi:Pre-rRNA-processing protein PNO1 [Podospora aff. communis PSN243]|uniref:Pre-rRNA-processing protein PNO1 n=1 Tax=Podospora aff. communis PSN243 TaxID=3040156 RepID=A0AAV9GCM2_9PEZI|nr:Pre-rRNA-processing protein PNO1 [Podospora aff. communis PSN243]
MPAPTALQKPLQGPATVPLPAPEQAEDELILDIQESDFADPNTGLPPVESEDTEMAVDEEGRPKFAPGKDLDPVRRIENRKIPIPPNRMSALKTNWSKIYPPLVDHCKLQVRMNVKEKRVELRSSKFTQSTEALQMGADFVSAFAMGFDIDDAIALLRLDSLYIQSFDIKDVRQTLGPDALGRAIGRIAGKDGKTKFAIENATKTRIVLAGSRIHILGAFENIGMARESVVSLVLGAQPGKVYNNLRIISSRLKERF